MNSSKVRRLASSALLVLLAACGSDDLSTADFNVHYQVGKREKYLGVARGLDQCGALAYSQASLDNVAGTDRWSYVCCKITKDSQCESKHR